MFELRVFDKEKTGEVPGMGEWVEWASRPIRTYNEYPSMERIIADVRESADAEGQLPGRSWAIIDKDGRMVQYHSGPYIEKITPEEVSYDNSV